MATMKEVAIEAGVSVASVSRYMNNKGYVGDDAQKRIAAAIKKLNYTPNEIARSLFQKKTNMIGLILPDISNPFFPMLARGVEDYLSQKNYQMVLGNAANDVEREKQYYDSFQNYNFSGIISSSEPVDKKQLNIPYIVIDRPDHDTDFYVASDHEMGGQLIASSVIASNPKNILLMIGPKEIESTQIRARTIQDIFSDEHVSYVTLEVDTLGVENINSILKEIFSIIQTVDTIIATNDIHAIYIAKEAMKRGMRIPEDIQIIGYDGIDFAELFEPKITTVIQPMYQMGYLAAEMLIESIEGKEIKSRKVKLPVALNDGRTLRK